MLAIGQGVIEILKNDLANELQTVPRLNKGIQLCRDLGDNGTESLLTSILVESEEHVDWLEAQLTLVAQLGDAHYLSQQIR
jgi:bacterioferritin